MPGLYVAIVNSNVGYESDAHELGLAPRKGTSGLFYVMPFFHYAESAKGLRRLLGDYHDSEFMTGFEKAGDAAQIF